MALQFLAVEHFARGLTLWIAVKALRFPKFVARYLRANLRGNPLGAFLGLWRPYCFP